MIKQSTTSQRIYPVYVVFGKNRWMLVEKVSEITDEVLADSDPQLALSSYEGGSAELADVLDALRTAPFLSERRLVVVKEADAFISQYRQNLEEYLKAPSETGVLLLVPDSFPGTTRLAKLAAKVGKLVSCEPVKPRELSGVLIGYARQRYDMRLTPEAAGLLVELVGDEAGALCGEIDKLATYLNGPTEKKDRIEPADVLKLAGNNRQYNVFNAIDAMTAGQTDVALQRLDRMLSQDREAEYKSVGAFAWHFRRLYNARLMLDQRINEQAIIKQLGIWSQQKEFIRQVRQLNIDQIGDCLCKLRDIDLANKTGAGTVRSGLEKLIVEFKTGVFQN
jgi:DNA polymerase-3 subunit delta